MSPCAAACVRVLIAGLAVLIAFFFWGCVFCVPSLCVRLSCPLLYIPYVYTYLCHQVKNLQIQGDFSAGQVFNLWPGGHEQHPGCAWEARLPSDVNRVRPWVQAQDPRAFVRHLQIHIHTASGIQPQQQGSIRVFRASRAPRAPRRAARRPHERGEAHGGLLRDLHAASAALSGTGEARTRCPTPSSHVVLAKRRVGACAIARCTNVGLRCVSGRARAGERGRAHEVRHGAEDEVHGARGGERVERRLGGARDVGVEDLRGVSERQGEGGRTHGFLRARARERDAVVRHGGARGGVGAQRVGLHSVRSGGVRKRAHARRRAAGRRGATSARGRRGSARRARARPRCRGARTRRGACARAAGRGAPAGPP